MLSEAMIPKSEEETLITKLLTKGCGLYDLAEMQWNTKAEKRAVQVAS